LDNEDLVYLAAVLQGIYK